MALIASLLDGPFGFVVFFLSILHLVFVLIAVHEAGHFLFGLTGGIPAHDMKLVLLAFPQHVALRDGDEWVSPVRDIARYIGITQRHLSSRGAAFRWVAGGMVLELAFVTLVWIVCRASGYPTLAFWTASISLGMYLINVCLMDVPCALLHRCACGDTSGLWQIAPVSAVLFSVVMLASRLLLVACSI